jgi:hypothetical protein
MYIKYLKIEPVTSVKPNSENDFEKWESVTISLKCIPTIYLETNTISDLKKSCNTNVVQDKFNLPKVIQTYKKFRNIIIFNFSNNSLNEFILDKILEIINNKFLILKSNPKLFQNNLLVFNLDHLSLTDIDSPDCINYIINCIEIIYEEFIYKVKKRSLNLLIRNYRFFRYTPKCGFCKYILNKQYDEYLQNCDRPDEYSQNCDRPVKKAKLN